MDLLKYGILVVGCLDVEILWAKEVQNVIHLLRCSTLLRSCLNNVPYIFFKMRSSPSKLDLFLVIETELDGREHACLLHIVSI